jgi:carbamoyl-phosphate synthase L subunit-like protein
MSRPIAVLYENEAWMAPLFAALEDAGFPYRRLFGDDLIIDPTEAPADALLVNKVSPSSYLRGHTRSIVFARSVLAHYEAHGVPVVNGSRAYDLELSKAKQLLLLSRLGLPHPRGIAANSPEAVLRAAQRLRFPVIVKPNVGGSGALMRVFADEADLRAQAASLDLGIDGTLVVQEYVAPAGDAIIRLEILDGEALYAISIGIDPAAGFNLCPADICQVPDTGALDNCVVDAAKQRRPIERVDVPARTWREGLAIAEAAGLDVCGIEYLVDQRTGEHLFYDINALSNFVTDAPRIVGFDPHARFVEYLARRARMKEAVLTGS